LFDFDYYFLWLIGDWDFKTGLIFDGGDLNLFYYLA
jgi:hypothetical protein